MSDSLIDLSEVRGDFQDVNISSVQIPITDVIIEEVAGEYGIQESELVEGLRAHYQDMYGDGTVFGFVRQLISDGECYGVCVGKSELFLAVSPVVWERERQWLDVDEAVLDAAIDAHDTMMRDSVDGVEGAIHSDWKGYVIGTKTPVGPILESTAFSGPALETSERAEFLYENVGMGTEKALVYALYEWQRFAEDESGVEAVTDVLDMRSEEAKAIIEDINEWQSGMAEVLSEFDPAGDGELKDQEVFGIIASMND